MTHADTNIEGDHECRECASYERQLKRVMADGHKKVSELESKLDAYDDVLRDLASYVGNGGYNSEGLIDPEQARAKVRDGIDFITKVEGERRIAAESRLHSMREALELLRPGLILDLRYATDDDDIDALRSRVDTIEAALAEPRTVVETHVHKFEDAGACKACECGAVEISRDVLKGTGVLSE